VITSPTVLINIVSKSEGRKLDLVIARKGVTSKQTEISAEETPQGWRIGLPLATVTNIATEEVKRSVGESFIVAWARGIDMAKAPFKFIKKIFNGGIQLKAMSGPIGIVQIMGKTTQAGFIEFILLLALISMNLGIMNLLPLAITDGGILMFLALEFIRKKPLPVAVEGKIQQVATLFFISLFLYITFQDVLRFPTMW
jgi:regulator of sigma E protease